MNCRYFYDDDCKVKDCMCPFYNADDCPDSQPNLETDDIGDIKFEIGRDK